MRGGRTPRTIAVIIARYPVIWCEQAGLTYAGSLVLGPSSLTLDGSIGGARSVVELQYDELVHVGVAGRRERVRGRPTLIVDVGGRSLSIAFLSEAGVIAEAADALARAMPVA